MTATTVAREVRRAPRPRHLYVVPAGMCSSATRPGGARPGAPGLRLTRRGRRVVAAAAWCAVAGAAALAVLLAVLVLGGSAEAGPGVGERVASVEYVVRPGETLWGIASAWAPDQDPRDAVAELVEFNALPGVGLLAGQRLLLPERG